MNKVAIITGSTSGIGEATAIRFAHEGFKVIITGRREKQGKEVEKEITRKGGMALYIPADLTSRSDASQLISQARNFGDILVLVNNAGGNNGQSVEKEIATNFFSAVYCTEEAIKMMAHGSSIVNVASICGCSTICNDIAYYSAAKAALRNYTKNMAKNLAPDIRVNAVLPGYTKTPDWGELTREKEHAYAQQVPIKRFISPEEIADAIWFLSQNEAVTGTELVVDGGRTLE